MFDEISIMNELSDTLKKEVLNFNFRELITKVREREKRGHATHTQPWLRADGELGVCVCECVCVCVCVFVNIPKLFQ